MYGQYFYLTTLYICTSVTASDAPSMVVLAERLKIKSCSALEWTEAKWPPLWTQSFSAFTEISGFPMYKKQWASNSAQPEGHRGVVVSIGKTGDVAGTILSC